MTVSKHFQRWLAVPFGAAIAFFAAATIVYWPLHAAVLLACPSPVEMATTDMSKPDYSSYGNYCMTPWFRFAEGGVFLVAIIAAAITCAVVAHKVAPGKKRAVSLISFAIAIAAAAVALYVTW